MALPVTACKVHRNVIVLLVGLPDSTLAIPEWMARPEAAALGLRSPPLIPVQHLRELQITLDSLLSSLSDNSISGGGHEATTGFRSTDFIQLNQPGLMLRAMERAALVPLVQRMLLEIVLSGIACTSNEEGDDE